MGGKRNEEGKKEVKGRAGHVMDNDVIQQIAWDGIGYLRASLDSSTAALNEQSLPPYPVLHTHDALHMSVMVQDSTKLPEGSL